TMPLRLATWLGFLAASAGFLIAVWAALTKIFQVPSPRGWASTMAAILFVGGVQLLMLGVVGEYLGRVYDEVRRRPLYIVRARVVALDAERIHARRLGPGLHYAVGDLRALPLAPAAFDVVLALDVFEHLDDDATALAEAARLLKADGTLVVTVPALPSLWGAQ